MRKALPLLILTLCAACATDGGVPSVCAPWRPVLVGEGDSLTRPTAEAVLAHNETGARLCGWKGSAQ